jgi:hypothetical protein
MFLFLIWFQFVPICSNLEFIPIEIRFDLKFVPIEIRSDFSNLDILFNFWNLIQINECVQF